MIFGLDPAAWFVGLPAEVAVFLLSIIPITEIRASIPIGIEVYGLPVWKVWIIGVLGDILPAFIILTILSTKLYPWLIESKLFGKWMTRELERADKKFRSTSAKFGLSLGLVLFIGIPLPFTGSWTGALASCVFNMPFKRSFPLIVVGVMLAATVITIITLFAGGVIRAVI